MRAGIHALRCDHCIAMTATINLVSSEGGTYACLAVVDNERNCAKAFAFFKCGAVGPSRGVWVMPLNPIDIGVVAVCVGSSQTWVRWHKLRDGSKTYKTTVSRVKTTEPSSRASQFTLQHSL